MAKPKPTFFARYAILILVIVFFLVPFALRGARMAIQGMKNDVKDWLPKEFAETRDLDDFRKYFLSEQFVLVSWDGCYGDETDERFRLFVAKLTPEVAPSVLKAQAEAAAGENLAVEPADAAADNEAAEKIITNPTRYVHRGDEFIGDQLGLYATSDWYENWGQRGEKWLKGRKPTRGESNEEAWYYITPDGDLFQWEGVDAPLAALGRLINRAMGNKEVQGTLVHSFGPSDGAWYHADPRRLRAQLFKTITTGPDVLASLTRDGGELGGSEENEAEAIRRLSGNLFGPPDPETGKRTTCIMLTLTDAARRNLHLVLGRGMLGKPRGILYEIAGETNIPRDELRMGGPPVDNVAIDEEGSITLVRLIGLSAALGIFLSLLCFRSITATIMIFFVGGISAVMSLAFVWWSGSSIDAIMMSMPSLVYVLGLSGAAHIINYYREALDNHGPVGAPESAISHGWRPAVLCNVTTAIGLVTLVTSELVPIRKFGLYSAIGVMATLIILFTYLPAALQIWPQKPSPKRDPSEEEDSWLGKLLHNFWGSVANWIIGHHALVSTACVLLIIAVGFGLTRMKTSVNLLKMFQQDSKIIRDYEWLEANLGQLVPMEIVIRVPKEDQRPSNAELSKLADEMSAEGTSEARQAEIRQQLTETAFQMPFLERMELAARVQRLAEQEFGPEGRDKIGRAISAATFVRPLPAAGGSTSDHLTRASTSGRLEAHREQFLHSDYLRVEEGDGTELWRISLRVGATKGVDYGEFVSDLKQTVEPVLAAQQARQQVLRRMAEKTAAQAPARSRRNAVGGKVLIVGVPAEVIAAHAKPAAEEAAAGDDSGESGDEGKSGDKGKNGKKASPEQSAVAAKTAEAPAASQSPVDQERIFAETLVDLLTISRLKVSAHAAGEPLAANFAEQAAAYDCIVVVGDSTHYALADLRKASPLVIDARQHGYVPHSEQLTAYEADRNKVSAVYTGVVPIVYKAQRMLLDSLVQSTFWSVIMITPLLMFIARSVWAGLVAMLPNVLPVLMVFGGMGWLDIDVDVGSMMTASIALGVAVDDTIHYLNWFRKELDDLGDRKLAIVAAYRHCATPTIQAATISGLGLSIFALSTFTPTQRFGILMLVILWLGAVAELIFFPALLAGPLGRVFKPRKKAGHESDRHDSEHTTAGPPQLQVVRGDDLVDEGEADEPTEAPHRGAVASGNSTRHGETSEENGSAVPAPHGTERRVRRDGSHRQRG
jgi:predicted RND superfamily exporter protein